MTDKNKVAFIICTNDDAVLKEAEYYIDSIDVPEGMTVEKVFIRDAVSMTSGYNRGMSSSDAKYKVYMHHDVFIINKNLIHAMTDAFKSDEKLGILGVIGTPDHVKNGVYVYSWSFGAISTVTPFRTTKGSSCEGKYLEAVACDGLMLMTQYDIPWREDIFTHWDFYDVSQCFEFTRNGYKVGIIDQEEDNPFCYHDTEDLEPQNYFKEISILQNEYRNDIYPYDESAPAVPNEIHSLYETMQEFYGLVSGMMSTGKTIEAMELLLEYRKAMRGHRKLAYLKKVSLIYREEKERYGESYFVRDNSTEDVCLKKLRALRYAIKRLEFLGEPDDLYRMLLAEEEDGGVTPAAIALGSVVYVQKWQSYMETLAKKCVEMHSEELYMDIQTMVTEITERFFKENPDGKY